MMVENYDVKRIFIDNGSLANVFFYNVFQWMKLLAGQLKKVDALLIGFSGNSITIEGEITLPMIEG